VLDFTGELNRWAIMRATARDKEAVAGARDLVDGLMGRFLEVGGEGRVEDREMSASFHARRQSPYLRLW
jgi:hypothetical protein